MDDSVAASEAAAAAAADSVSAAPAPSAPSKAALAAPRVAAFRIQTRAPVRAPAPLAAGFGGDDDDDDDGGDHHLAAAVHQLMTEDGNSSLAPSTQAPADSAPAGAAPDATCAAAKKLARSGEAKAKAAKHRRQGEACALAGDLEEALRQFDIALHCNAADPFLHEARAQVLLETGDYFAAVQAATRATEIDSSWVPAWRTLGRAQLNLGELQLAETSLGLALRLNPADEARNDHNYCLKLLALQRRAAASDLAPGGALPRARGYEHGCRPPLESDEAMDGSGSMDVE